MDIDYDMGEETLQRAKAINEHIKTGTMPDPIGEEMWCNGCPFAHICLPEQIGKEVAVDTGELATMLDRMEELKPIVKEYEEIDEQVKETVKGREQILAGNYFITGKYMTRKSYDVPADLKAQFEKVTQYWKTTIKRLAA